MFHEPFETAAALWTSFREFLLNQDKKRITVAKMGRNKRLNNERHLNEGQ